MGVLTDIVTAGKGGDSGGGNDGATKKQRADDSPDSIMKNRGSGRGDDSGMIGAVEKVARGVKRAMGKSRS